MTDICPHCKRPLDLTVGCARCGRVFSITVDEQLWFAGRGLANPKRCERCRQELRRANGNAGSRTETTREHERR